MKPAAAPQAPVRQRTLQHVAGVQARAGLLCEVRAAVVVLALPAGAERPRVEQGQAERGAGQVSTEQQIGHRHAERGPARVKAARPQQPCERPAAERDEDRAEAECFK